MGRFWKILIIGTVSLGIWGGLTPIASANDAFIYNIYRPLDMGDAASPPPKDFFINSGTAQGIHKGTVLTVYRRLSTYDLLSEKLYKEIAFPIARIKVIFSETGASIARLDKMLPSDETPGLVPNSVMLGDLVRLSD